MALDRIVTVEEATKEEYIENTLIDLSTYYSDVLGVTKSPNQKDCEVVFRVDHENAPYVITKPLHHTQKLLTENADGKVFSIRVIINYELERELLGFGCKLRVLGPRILVRRIRENLEQALKCYESAEEGEIMEKEV